MTFQRSGPLSAYFTKDFDEVITKKLNETQILNRESINFSLVCSCQEDEAPVFVSHSQPSGISPLAPKTAIVKALKGRQTWPTFFYALECFSTKLLK